MSAKAEAPIRFVRPASGPTLVLRASRGRIRGKAHVTNVGAVPIHVAAEGIAAAAVRGRRAPDVALDPAHVTVVAPGETEVARFVGTLDPFTPPGTYKAKVTVNGVEEDAVVEVAERVSIRVAESEIVVLGEPGPQQRRTIVTNRGNVPLRISRLGPVELAPDPTVPLLRRIELLLEKKSGDDPPRREHDRDEPHEPAPKVEASLESPVELAPGETAALDWTVTVEGTLDPGVRYRALAALYTSTVEFVVAPAQDGPTPQRTDTTRTRKKPAPRPDTAPRAPAAGRKRRPS